MARSGRKRRTGRVSAWWLGAGAAVCAAIIGLMLGGVGLTGASGSSRPATADTRAVPVVGDHSRAVPVSGASAVDLPAGPARPALLRAERHHRLFFIDGHYFFLNGHGPTNNVTPASLAAHVGPLPAGWHATVHTLVVGGRIRTYVVVEPDVIRGRVPMYVVLHGRSMDADSIMHVSDLAPRTGPAVLVYPDGWRRSWNAGDCCGYAHLDGVNDVAFVHTVVDGVLASTPAVDPAAVWLLGFSNGGRMTYRLACDLPGTFAGFAAVEAVPVTHCADLHPLDVAILAQRRDPLLTITDREPRKSMEGYVEPTVQSTVRKWRRLDGCTDGVVRTTAGRTITRTWSCADGTRLRYIVYRGGAHVWPRGGTQRILDFFDSSPAAVQSSVS